MGTGCSRAYAKDSVCICRHLKLIRVSPRMHPGMEAILCVSSFCVPWASKIITFPRGTARVFCNFQSCNISKRQCSIVCVYRGATLQDDKWVDAPCWQCFGTDNRNTNYENQKRTANGRHSAFLLTYLEKKFPTSVCIESKRQQKLNFPL